MYINVIWAAFRYSLRRFNIVRVTYAIGFEHLQWVSERNLVSCQSMTLMHLTSKNRNGTYVHPGDRFFDFYTSHYNNFFRTA